VFEAVLRVLKSDWLTQGPQIQKFENSLKAYFNSNYCTVLSSGTAALHLAVLTLGWNKEDIIITTPISFLATSNCILYCGATPSFVDIESKYFTIDVEKLEQKIKLFKKREKKIVGIIATDYAGHPCDWKSLRKIADRYGLKLINDNCHALGAQIDNDKGYAIKYADLVTHSYHPVKNITTGEGGSILTNNKYLDKKIKSLRSHGVDQNTKNLWFYEMKDLGFNYRISDIQCTLGISQLKKINKFLKRRNEVAKMYNKAFSNDMRFKIFFIIWLYMCGYIMNLKVNFFFSHFFKQNLF
jgi:dTDP-4-amino-4,6-dideoxygalactose transaminase